MGSDTVTISAKYNFTEDEKKSIGSDLARKHLKKQELQDAKKLSNSRYKEQIDSLLNEISLSSINLGNGYEFRDYKCTVEFDYKKKRKKFIDIHTGKVVDEREFEPHDYQRPLPLPNPLSTARD